MSHSFGPLQVLQREKFLPLTLLFSGRSYPQGAYQTRDLPIFTYVQFDLDMQMSSLNAASCILSVSAKQRVPRLALKPRLFVPHKPFDVLTMRCCVDWWNAR